MSLFVSNVFSCAVLLPVLILRLALVNTNIIIAVTVGDIYITLLFAFVVADFLLFIYLALTSGNISVGGGESYTRLVRNRSNAAAFLTVLPSSTELWNERRQADNIFLTSNVTPFQPHTNHGVVPEEVLSEFCHLFLVTIHVSKNLDQVSLQEEAQTTVRCLNLFANSSFATSHGRKSAKICPLLVWDTGASFGLTLFRSDVIAYTECNITVNDITCSNTVIGIGTTLHKFQVDGEDYFFPCVSYYPPSAEICLFGPKTYHTL